MNFNEDLSGPYTRLPSSMRISKPVERHRRNNSSGNAKSDLNEFEIYQDLSLTYSRSPRRINERLLALVRNPAGGYQDKEDHQTSKEYMLLQKINATKNSDMSAWLKDLYRAVLKIQIMLKSPKKLFSDKDEGLTFQEELSQMLETILSQTPSSLKERDLEVFVSLMEILREMDVLKVSNYQKLGIAYLSCCFKLNIRYEQDFLDSLLALLDKKELILMLQEQFRTKTPKSTAKKALNEIFDYSDMVLCVICQEHLRKILFNPCKHFITCENCASKCSICPVCRGKIVEKSAIYWT